MTLAASLWQEVRQRAHGACEYCGVSEIDAGGMLTVDHYQPRAHDGTDDLNNLIYCCFRCNNYKGDYWPAKPTDPALWNPRQESADKHWLLLADGSLHPTSSTGTFTLKLLQLNRPPLAAHRLRKLQELDTQRRLELLEKTLSILERLRQQRVDLLHEHGVLLEEHRRLLELLLRSFD